MRLIFSGLVALALLVVTVDSATACNGRVRNGLKAVAKRVVNPFNGRFRR